MEAGGATTSAVRVKTKEGSIWGGEEKWMNIKKKTTLTGRLGGTGIKDLPNLTQG